MDAYHVCGGGKKFFNEQTHSLFMIEGSPIHNTKYLMMLYYNGDVKVRFS